MPRTPTYFKIAPNTYYTGTNQQVSDPNTLSKLEGGQIPFSTVQKGLERQFTDPDFFGKVRRGEIDTSAPTKPVGIISTDQAIPILNNAQKDQTKDLEQLTVAKTTEEKNKAENQKNYIQRVKNQGGLTADEIGAIGGDVSNYDFVSSAGLYLPKQVQSEEDIYKQDLEELNSVFKDQQAFIDQSEANLMSNIDQIYTKLAQEQKEINYRSERNLGTSLLRSGIARYSPISAGALMTANASEGLRKLSDIASKQAIAMAEAQQLINNKEYDLFVKKREEINTLKKERIVALKELQTEAKKKGDEIEKQKKQIEIDNIVALFIQNGETNPVEILQAMNDAGYSITAEELNKTLKVLNPAENLAGLSPDYRTYKYLQDNDDPSVKGLSWLEYKQAVFNATRKATTKSDSSLADQIMDGFTNPSDLTPSQRQKARDELYERGFNSDTSPQWFVEYTRDKEQQSLRPDVITKLWLDFKNGIMGKFEEEEDLLYGDEETTVTTEDDENLY